MAEKKPELSRFFCWLVGTEKTSAVVFAAAPVDALRIFRQYLADGKGDASKGVIRVVAFKDSSRKSWRVDAVWDVPQWGEALNPSVVVGKPYLNFVVANRWNHGDLIGVSM
jgi:hypothetical protein